MCIRDSSNKLYYKAEHAGRILLMGIDLSLPTKDILSKLEFHSLRYKKVAEVTRINDESYLVLFTNLDVAYYNREKGKIERNESLSHAFDDKSLTYSDLFEKDGGNILLWKAKLIISSLDAAQIRVQLGTYKSRRTGIVNVGNREWRELTPQPHPNVTTYLIIKGGPWQEIRINRERVDFYQASQYNTVHVSLKATKLVETKNFDSMDLVAQTQHIIVVSTYEEEGIIQNIRTKKTLKTFRDDENEGITIHTSSPCGLIGKDGRVCTHQHLSTGRISSYEVPREIDEISIVDSQSYGTVMQVRLAVDFEFLRTFLDIQRSKQLALIQLPEEDSVVFVERNESLVKSVDGRLYVLKVTPS
eukprot:TRINITY_DN5179_c0_g1_i4.p1 TRINITY_DN5179_c0_g1~~TRINITY_DN5179_c0_g1_i4.p1  ORF type:complete len:374 (+),score=27.08 TRINITY_DN5179_c0_g1_i4:47-1123(+)